MSKRVVLFPKFSRPTVPQYAYGDNKFWQTNQLNGFKERQKFEIENLNEKLWIHWSLTVCDEQNQFMASSLIPKIYRCDFPHLSLSHQCLTFGEFRKFISSGTLKMLDLYVTTVKNGDGTIVPIEKMIEFLPKLQIFQYKNVSTEEGFRTINSETATNLNKISHFHQIKIINMTETPESFNFEAFFATPKVRTSMFN